METARPAPDPGRPAVPAPGASHRLRLPLETSDICRLIPHRPPFLLVDRVVALDPGRSGTGIKELRADDALFSGHFPDRPIFPGVLIVEACAQLGAIIMAAAASPVDSSGPGGERVPPVGYLAAVNRFKFFAPAVPGECLVMRVRIGTRVQSLLQLVAEASCGGRLVGRGEIVVTLVPADGADPEERS